MSYFPDGKNVELHEGIESKIYELGDAAGTTIIISHMAPGVSLEHHSHSEAQFGLALKGTFTLFTERESFDLKALSNGYYLPPNTIHGAVNSGNEEAITVDVKRNLVESGFEEGEAKLMQLTKQRVIKTGIVMEFLVGPWFEIMISALPEGGTMPQHKHANEQIGISVSGSYTIQVGMQEWVFEYPSVYYAPGSIVHGGFNPNPETAVSLNILIPPRYNKTPKGRQSVDSIMSSLDR